MDKNLKEKLSFSIEKLKANSLDGIDLDNMDPIARMMLVALLNEVESIENSIISLPDNIVERFCTHFIPYKEICAVPAITLIAPQFRKGKDTECTYVTDAAKFSFKTEKTSRTPLNYIPLFETLLVPHADVTVVTSGRQKNNETTFGTDATKQPHTVWVGIATDAEIESLKGLSLLIRGTHGVMPQKVMVASNHRDMPFATMREMENIDMLQPFDAQQASGWHFSFIREWKDSLLNMKDATLMYITDDLTDRDVFKPLHHPKAFAKWLTNETQEKLPQKALWLQLEFPHGYTVPDDCQVQLNVLPVVNVDVASVTINDYQPIKKLDNKEGTFFVGVLNPSNTEQRQGISDDEFIIRDFDAHRYHDGDLYHDVSMLYNHFVDDYYAFAEYNGVAKDKEALNQLRNDIKRLGENVNKENDKFLYDSGTYVMKNISAKEPVSNVSVKYITTMGRRGNKASVGDVMENKKMPLIEQQVPVVANAMGGIDKASADARYEKLRYYALRYEKLRYYALTNDRLYTRQDIDAFIRQSLMEEFHTKEYGERGARRIFIRISVEGAAGDHALRRGLYIDLEFKDKKNYDYAVKIGFDTLMQQRIENRSCIAMPIIVTLKNLEE